ncbi:MAG: hypothetical protein H6923_02995 [Alphaproteobacteria bacterium]|nr:hypothetical protein [Alphaproteobacteria bacterium]
MRIIYCYGVTILFDATVPLFGIAGRLSEFVDKDFFSTFMLCMGAAGFVHAVTLARFFNLELSRKFLRFGYVPKADGVTRKLITRYFLFLVASLVLFCAAYALLAMPCLTSGRNGCDDADIIAKYLASCWAFGGIAVFVFAFLFGARIEES